MVNRRTASIYGSGEHRLPACSYRQLAEMLCVFVAATSLKVAGKLPATTGWQPVLPRINLPHARSKRDRAGTRRRSFGFVVILMNAPGHGLTARIFRSIVSAGSDQSIRPASRLNFGA